MTEPIWRIRFHRDGFTDSLSLLIQRGDQYVAPFTLEQMPIAGYIDRPTLNESREAQADGLGDVSGFLRAALNCAWELGMRPDGFEDTRESMAATKKHLEDMRAITFHKIGAPKP